MQTLTFTSNKDSEFYFAYWFGESGVLCIKGDVENDGFFACLQLACSSDKVIEVTHATIERENSDELAGALRTTLNAFKCDVLKKAKDQFFGLSYEIAPLSDSHEMIDLDDYEFYKEEVLSDIESHL